MCALRILCIPRITPHKIPINVASILSPRTWARIKAQFNSGDNFIKSYIGFSAGTFKTKWFKGYVLCYIGICNFRLLRNNLEFNWMDAAATYMLYKLLYKIIVLLVI